MSPDRPKGPNRPDRPNHPDAPPPWDPLKPPLRVPGDDRRRIFPAFAPRKGSRAPFADTWWGEAWLAALEQTSLDSGRLTRGRTYARGGHVQEVTVTPGRVAALVQGSRPRPYRAEVRLRTLTDAQWDHFLDSAAADPAHLAALLDKELPRPLADSAVRLLPAEGDLAPHCSCPDTGRPCKHAAALCYQAARLLDADPFVLLLMRGRGESELLEQFRRRNAARGAAESRKRLAAPTPAREAVFRTNRPPLPPPLPVPEHPGTGPALPDPEAGLPLDATAVELLAGDAASRAHAALVRMAGAASATGAGGAGGVSAAESGGPASAAPGPDPMPHLTVHQDAIRLAAAHPTAGLTSSTRALYARLAAETGRSRTSLARAVAAWRQGGPEALRLLDEPWNPPAGPFDRARPALAAADLPRLRPHANRLTDEHRGAQLRFGRDGRWYPYSADPGTPASAEESWWPQGEPDADPVGALTGLLAAGG
ncbi:SWIM zinc finger family protein [Streptomyces boninensis]|uniref:SWIM zinc finger family protein n=1 Tax=Streptomyces boninensis TaxID=2039455 RepID=UPI003B2178AB